MVLVLKCISDEVVEGDILYNLHSRLVFPLTDVLAGGPEKISISSHMVGKEGARNII